MSAQLTVVRETPDPAIMEQVVVVGDLTNMRPAQRVAYYNSVCRSLGLNPLTRPFDYLYLNKKLVLYARKDATEQLRKLNRVSITRLETEVTEGIYIVTAYAQSGDGRADSDIGAVAIQGLTGEAKSNAMMKAITKAKRRVTLSICGLGWLDETEVDSIPDARPVPVNFETGEIVEGQTTEPPAPRLAPPPENAATPVVEPHNLAADWDGLTDWVNESVPVAVRFENAWHLRQALAADINRENEGREGYKPVDGKRMPYPGTEERIRRVYDRAVKHAMSKLPAPTTPAEVVPDYEGGQEGEGF